MGNDGTAITLVGYGEMDKLNQIRTLTKTTIEEIEHLHSQETHKAVCSDCGEKCGVPFKPDPNRPVFLPKLLGKEKTAETRRIYKYNISNLKLLLAKLYNPILDFNFLKCEIVSWKSACYKYGKKHYM